MIVNVFKMLGIVQIMNICIHLDMDFQVQIIRLLYLMQNQGRERLKFTLINILLKDRMMEIHLLLLNGTTILILRLIGMVKN